MASGGHLSVGEVRSATEAGLLPFSWIACFLPEVKPYKWLLRCIANLEDGEFILALEEVISCIGRFFAVSDGWRCGGAVRSKLAGEMYVPALPG